VCAENGIDRCDDTQNEKGVAHRKSGVVHSLADSVEAFQLGEEPEDADDPKDTKELCIAESSIPGIHDFEKEGHELNTDNEAVKPDRCRDKCIRFSVICTWGMFAHDLY
jgi:hypothetical protein